MGAFTDLIKMMLKDSNIDNEKTIRALEDEGKKDADEIAERLAPKDKTAFVPKVDVTPVKLPEDCEKNESGEMIKKDNKAGKEEKERDD